MRLAAISLTDPGIVVVTDDGSVVGPSPGMALLDGRTLTVGSAAAAQRRLQPRRIHDHYWEQLDTEPLARPFPGHLSTADLAHAQLAEIWKDVGQPIEAVLVAVPPTFDRKQLGLLLGIGEAAGIPIRGLVNSAVAAIAGRNPSAGPLVHVDVLLHRVVVTCALVDRKVSRVKLETDDGIGLLSLHGALTRTIAGRFIRSTRFDPLKLATTEQQLYDLLPPLLDELDRAVTVPLRMAAGGQEYEIELAKNTLAQACDGQVRRIVSLVSRCLDDEGTVLLTHRAATIPGLAHRLGKDRAGRIHTIDDVAAARGALSAAPHIIPDNGEITLVSRLPLHANDPTAPPRASVQHDGGGLRPGTPATHILYLGRAYPLSVQPLVVGVATGNADRGLDVSGNTAGISRSHCSLLLKDGRPVVEDHSTYGSYLNGAPIADRAELVAGDRLRLGSPGVVLEAIAVEEVDGAS